MESVGSILQTGLTALTLASLVGLGLLRGTVTNLRENLKDAREEIADKSRRLDEAEQKVVEMKSSIDTLTKVVTGEVDWHLLTEAVDELKGQATEHHSEALRHWDRDETLLVEIRDRLPGRRD